MTYPTFAGLASALMKWNAEEQEKLAAWAKAFPIPGQDPKVVRRDFEGRVIRWDEYGKKSGSGWEKDHIWPLALNGADLGGNLRARHWEGNSAAGGRLAAALAAAGVRGRPR